MKAAILLIFICFSMSSLDALAAKKSKKSKSGAFHKRSLSTYLSDLKSGYVVENIDTEAKGKTNVFVVFRKLESGQKALVMQLFDLNGNGKIDLAKHFQKGVRVKMETDLDFDGKIDSVSEFDKKTGQLKRKIQYDGKTYNWKYWYKGELRRKEIDRNSDGEPDMWVHYRRGQVIKTEIDVNFDGKNIRVEKNLEAKK